MADYTDRDYPPIKDAALSAYVKNIGDRLLAVLPPTKIVFHYTIVDSPEVNGFSLAGGRVYLTRKLVASAHSEDEIAGVIAHEMGHILSHQFAVETTADLRQLLGVTAVGDRADVYAKYQRLVDARMHQRHPKDGDSDEKQDEADRVAVYAAAAAGYRAQAYAEFWDRSFFVGGKTGGALSDLFGFTTPSQKRLRRIRAILADLPQGCGALAEAHASPAFQQWQKAVLENRAIAPASTAKAATTLAAKSEVQLAPPLRMDLDRLRFSRDGKYILAQDQSSIFVLTREPFREVFRIDADGALPADFSPDSQQVAFTTPGLHVELWSIATQKLIAAHEIVAPYDCFQTMLAPDARTLECIYQKDGGQVGFALLDVGTGSTVYDLKSWFMPGPALQTSLYWRRVTQDNSEILTTSLSADGNLLLVGPGEDRLAFDLRTRTPIKIEGALKNSLYRVSYCFQGNDKVIMVNLQPEQSGVFSFPEGSGSAR